VVTARQLADVWNWIVQEISARPTTPQVVCIYDLKLWGRGAVTGPLEPITPFINALAYLYLASQLGDSRTAVCLVNDGIAGDIVVHDGQLDPDVRAVIENSTRFRNALSEHMAFWVSLATQKKQRARSRFACSQPNFQPEDKGPDGLTLIYGANPMMEVHSVKNSVNQPTPLISSPQFRRGGRAIKQKQLDDFWLCAHEGLA
jgi:hypothetical protein